MKEGLFKNKYRIQTTRLRGFNYGQPGQYFVTICTKNRISYFGDVINGEMVLNNIGKTAVQCWLDIPNHFPNTSLDEFIVMPNHVHGIINIDYAMDVVVETQNFASLHEQPYKNKFGPQSKNLASIVRGFKIGVKKWCTNNNIKFTWQPRYYDRIVRQEEALYKIRDYIHDNPSKWWRDRNNSQNIFM